MEEVKFLTVFANFGLQTKPDWMDAFRIKYDKPYPYHITLKTTATFDPKDTEIVKKQLRDICSNYKPIPISFNSIWTEFATKSWCIMIEPSDPSEIINLQKDISGALEPYSIHTSEKRRMFERNFRPHITIARCASIEALEHAKVEMGADITCSAAIDTVDLAIAPRDEYEEWVNPRSLTKFTLKG